MAEEYHIRVKKEYAASLIEHLKKEDAIELIEDTDPTIPEWQKKAALEALHQITINPSSLQSWDVIRNKYRRQE